ncbi:MAG: SH3 domain-containing protein [Anaerolineae bacterium]|nr:SH3 domain-containing protein [Anaerolineae bacterium]
MKRLNILLWACLLCVVPIVTVLGGEDCPTVVSEAIQMTGEACSATSRNEACYGYTLIDASPQTSVDEFTFEQIGDRTEVDTIGTLRLSPLELESGSWGVALLRLQANLPANNNANVTLVAFGDVAFDNAVENAVDLPVSVAVNSFVNVRRLPNAQAGAVGVLSPGQTVTAVERLADTSWLRVETPELSEPGWVLASLLEGEGDLSMLRVAEPTQPGYRPMQAFYFQSSSDAPACDEMPQDGLLIQTPEGVGEIRLWINEVKIDMGSTVYFQAQAGHNLTVMTLEGHATVEVDGVTSTAVAGSQLTVPLNEDLHPIGPPSQPVAYDLLALRGLPLGLLDRAVTPHSPLTPEEIQVAIETWSGSENGNSTGSGSIPGGSDTCCGDPASSGADPNADCPGSSCDPCPGSSCSQGNKDGNNGQGDGSGTGGGNSNGGGNGNAGGNGNGNGNGGGGS